jgi:exosome complex RNA-binding protein Csl4
MYSGPKGRVRAILKISQRRDRLVKAAKLNFQPVATIRSIINKTQMQPMQISIKGYRFSKLYN